MEEDRVTKADLTLIESALGLMINFDVHWINDGIKRVINPGDLLCDENSRSA